MGTDNPTSFASDPGPQSPTGSGDLESEPAVKICIENGA